MIHIYAIIIGSEILNNRRQDAHFTFVRDALEGVGHTLFASMVIKDDPILIRSTFELVRADSEGVMLSFGGIGSTPDDLTRQIASDVFGDGELYPHPTFVEDIVERFGEDGAYPHRIRMAHLPLGAGLLPNVINNMSGFSLQDRYFFMPGFPQMSHPMVEHIITHFLPSARQRYTRSLLAHTGENTLIDVMEGLEADIEFSSLPMITPEGPRVEIALMHEERERVEEGLRRFIETLERENIPYITLL